MKSLVNEYSSDVKVNFTFESFTVVLPLKAAGVGNESDCWIVSIGLGTVFSD